MKQFSLFFIGFIWLLLPIFNPAFSQVITNQAAGPAQPAASGNYFVSADGDSKYVAPVNSYDDNVTAYYFITQDAGKAGTSSVSYKSIAYPVTTIVTNDLGSTAAAPAIAANQTIFFDAGTYTETNFDYVRISKTNFSMVGLVNGTVTIQKTPATVPNKNERYIFMHQNLYFENLIFDGQGRDMIYNKEGGVGSGRGEYYIMVSGGSEGLVMKNCQIINVGASNSSINAKKNVAINIYLSAGQHNFENVSFSNIKTQSFYGILSLNDSKDNYFKDINIDASNASTSAFSIKIEHTVTTNPINTLTNIFAGALTLTNSNAWNGVYIQDYQYGNTSLPSTFRYVRASTTNGSNSKNAVIVSPILAATANNVAYWDLNDNYWIVRASSSSPNVQNQLTYINTVLNTVSSLGVPNNVPPANIKLEQSGGAIPTFTQPDMATKTVNIVAVNNYADNYNVTALIPVAANAAIGLHSATAPTTKLYNFDFHQLASCTMEEAVTGRVVPTSLTDPNEPPATAPAGYPVFSTYGSVSTARVSGSLNTTFENCKFTSLIQEIKWTSSAASIPLDQTATFAAAISQTPADSYTHIGYTSGMQETAGDRNIRYYSSDPAIVTVDPITGVATPVSIGSAKIYAKAIDANNQGEIEKPWLVMDVDITKSLPVVFSDVSASVDNGLLNICWNTAREKNNDHFDIEASTDGIRFVKIGSIYSKANNGFSDSPIAYTFRMETSKAKSLLSISIFAICFVSLLFVRKNKLVYSLIFVLGVTSLATVSSCSKKDRDINLNKDSTLYIRIAQIEKDGTVHYSKIVQAVKK